MFEKNIFYLTLQLSYYSHATSYVYQCNVLIHILIV